MKILLISGHGAGDCGACGNGYKEADLTRELVNLIAPKLKDYATVTVYDQTRNAFKDCQNGKFGVGTNAYNYALEIHFNAFDKTAKGTEIFVTTKEKGITVEQGIMKKMDKYFKLRDADGVKVKNYTVINTLKKRCISSALLEVCFIDNKEDMKVYQANKNAIAQDIVDAIADGFGLKKKVTVKTVKVGSTVKVASNAVIGGLASNRGDKASSYLKSKTWKVEKIQTNKGVKEALLSCDTWVAVKYLTAI